MAKQKTEAQKEQAKLKAKARNITKLIMTDDRYVAVTTLDIAEITGKRHDHVMRDARALIKEVGYKPLFEIEETAGLPKFGESSRSLKKNYKPDDLSGCYIESTYKNRQNKKQPMIILGRRVAMNLGMGYSGKLRDDVLLHVEALEKAMQSIVYNRDALASGYRPMTDALLDQRLEHGKEPSQWIYINDAKMLCEIITGCTPKKYKSEHGHEWRDHVSGEDKELAVFLQRSNTTYIEDDMNYHERKGRLIKKAAKWRKKRQKTLT